MRTPREKAIALVKSLVDAEVMPFATIRSIKKLNLEWRQPPIGDKTRIGAGTQATLFRLVAAAETFQKALEDAKAMLEIP